MTQHRRRLLTAATAVVAAGVLGACGGSSGTSGPTDALPTDEEITLTVAWWGDDDRADRYAEALALFTEEHPNITVQPQYQSWEDYWTARSTEAAGKALPDVFAMDASYLRQYASSGQLADLSAQVGTHLDVSGIDEALLSTGEDDGALVAVPTGSNTLATFVNLDLLDELGLELPAEGFTWDDYGAWLAEASAAGSSMDPAVYGGPDFTAGAKSSFSLFGQWLIQQGVQPFTDDGRLGFAEEDLARWLHLGDELRESGASYPAERRTQIQPQRGLGVNELVSDVDWDSLIASIRAESGVDDFTILPAPSGDHGPQMYWKPATFFAASASSEQPAAAATLIDFLINDPEVGRIFGTSKGVPAVAAQRDAIDLEPGSPDEQVLDFEADVADLVTEPAPIPVEGYGSLEAEYQRLGEELQYGNITVDEFVAQWFSAAADAVGPS
ncbi:ABC transporter substrate-binding protein [Isoptericola croceus]|uniref:ABC transporter substrate-binding protein n=1 Tax=Isoptericola croceus TaxID=3031406 RepID=UPI0023F8B0EB|nr:extracellular solute-binding protein [Isoptericola croceus]